MLKMIRSFLFGIQTKFSKQDSKIVRKNRRIKKFKSKVEISKYRYRKILSLESR